MTAVLAPPHNFEAEQGLLGTVLHRPDVLDETIDYLKPMHFAQPIHGRIYDNMIRLQKQGRPISREALAPMCGEADALKDVNGAAYLDTLAESVVSTLNGPEYARQIVDSFQRRELLAIAEQLESLVRDQTDVEIDAQAIVAQLDGRIAQVLDDDPRDAPVSLHNAALEALEHIRAVNQGGLSHRALSTGLVDFDRAIIGLFAGNYIIIAGRPGMGKSALALDIGEWNAKQGKRVVFFSLEMSGMELAMRAMAPDSGISATDQMRAAELHATHIDQLEHIAERFAPLPLDIVERGGLTISGLRGQAARIKRKSGLDLIIVDYLQLLRGETRQAQSSKVHEVTEISNGLKALAKELRVPVIALSQLSRAVEHRDDKRPTLADLRESGSLEQDADRVIFVYREAYYLERMKLEKKDTETQETWDARWASHQERLSEVRNVAELIVAKHRHGPTSTVRVHFQAETTHFSNLARNN